jgi:hypothetical protein
VRKSLNNPVTWQVQPAPAAAGEGDAGGSGDHAGGQGDAEAEVQGGGGVRRLCRGGGGSADVTSAVPGADVTGGGQQAACAAQG